MDAQLAATSAVGFAATYGLLFAQSEGGADFVGQRRAPFVSRVVSNVHAVLVSGLGLACLNEALRGASRYVDDPHTMVWGSTKLTSVTCSVFIGYLAYDLALCLSVPALREASTLLHHVLFLGIAVTCARHAFLKFPFVWLILGELSTPFVNFRWVLAQRGQKDSRLYRLNGWAMLASFCLLRVGVYGWGLLDLFTRLWPAVEAGTSAGLEPLRAIPFLLGGGFALNLFWAAKMTRGAMRHVGKPKAE